MTISLDCFSGAWEGRDGKFSGTSVFEDLKLDLLALPLDALPFY